MRIHWLSFLFALTLGVSQAETLSVVKVAVSDVTRAVVPGADVTVRSASDLSQKTAKTDVHGVAVFSLAHGNYQFSAVAQGFSGPQVKVELQIVKDQQVDLVATMGRDDGVYLGPCCFDSSNLLLIASEPLTEMIVGIPAQIVQPEGPVVDAFTGHPRVVILSDIGNEPDDQMSFVRLMLYSNELDLEAMIASTSTWQKTATHPETMHAIVAAYGQVRSNLTLHAKGWPEAKALDERIFAGQSAYGMAATGKGKSSAGSQALMHAIERDDPRPLWVCLWGGANTLAQSLIDLRETHSAAEMETLISRLRVSSISDQDDAGAWLRREFPTLFYVVQPSSQNGEEYYYATWTGISGDLYYSNGAGADTSLVTNEWLQTHIRDKGPLGRMYPKFMFIMEGDTPSYLGLIDNGLNAYRRPDWGGWGGRYVYRQPYGETHPVWAQGGDEFTRATSQDKVRGVDGVEHISDQATIWRWREAYQNDFAARMDWTIRDFAHANHAPQLVVNGVSGTGPVQITVDEKQTTTLDATGSSDPDGNMLHYRWWVYEEAGLSGTHGADVAISDAENPKASVTIKSACREAWIPGLIPCKGEGVAHIILEVSDDGTPRLTSYRRVVLHVIAPAAAGTAPKH